MNPEDSRVEVITTGQPLVQLLACTACGVLLWNAEKHWADAHPATAQELSTQHATTCALLVRNADCDCPLGRKP